MNALEHDINNLKPLVDSVISLSSLPIQKERKEMWSLHNALKRTHKIPVCVTYEGIPEKEWDVIFGADHLKCISPLAKGIELDLKKRMWAAEFLEDDHIVWPFVKVNAVYEIVRDWGVKLEWEKSELETGASRIIPPFYDGVDLSKLKKPCYRIDWEETQKVLDIADDLVSSRMTVLPEYPNMGFQLFEIAVQMRGMESILLDVYDEPKKIRDMMEFITSAVIELQLEKEKNGWASNKLDESKRYIVPNVFRVNCSYAPNDAALERPLICNEWIYISAQSASGLGPEQYEEFVHPFNCRLASLYTNKTVYYHGCECLDSKLDILERLPNLRRFHVSPWSSVEKAAKKFSGSVVMEVHSNPANVLFSFSENQMKSEIQSLIDSSLGYHMDLNLSDIHSLGGNPEKLRTWTALAQEIAAK